MVGFIGKKVGMTRLYDDNGVMKAVTVIDLEGFEVLGYRKKEIDGYDAVIVGYLNRKKNKVVKIKEFRLEEGDSREPYSVDVLGDFKWVDVTGISKGKGFAGVMKRHGFGGGPDSHGSTLFHRRPGSSGQHTFPGKVWKGKKMPGRMGGEKVTVKNLRLAFVDSERKLIGVYGAVPGANGDVVFIKPSVKNKNSQQ